MECEWCGMRYPDGEWDYYYIEVWKKEHLICSDCYKHLWRIFYEKDKKYYKSFCEELTKESEV